MPAHHHRASPEDSPVGSPLHGAPEPCVTCPYRAEAPSGVWAATEYAKLPDYDAPTWAQPPALFMCHSGDATTTLCRGWVDVHHHRAEADRDLLALRMHADRIDWDTIARPCSTPLLESGSAAAEHGLRDLDHPEADAVVAMAKVQRLRDRRTR